MLQIAFYHLARKKMSLSQLLELAPTDGGPYGSHLQRHLRKLQAQPQLKAALKTILNETTAVRLNYAEKFKLHGMGLVVLEGNKVTFFLRHKLLQLRDKDFYFDLINLELVDGKFAK